tara:strand:- start:43687 stop:43791 length:105 start_codon:yes stop_codon:yes gene_type:complete
MEFSPPTYLLPAGSIAPAQQGLMAKEKEVPNKEE